MKFWGIDEKWEKCVNKDQEDYDLDEIHFEQLHLEDKHECKEFDIDFSFKKIYNCDIAESNHSQELAEEVHDLKQDKLPPQNLYQRDSNFTTMMSNLDDDSDFRVPN